MPTSSPDQDLLAPPPPDIFPAALAGLPDEQKADIRETFLAYGVSDEELPRYVADILGTIETIFDAYVAEKQGDDDGA